MSTADPVVVTVPRPPKNPLISKTMIVNGIVFLIGGLTAWLAPDSLAHFDPKVLVWLGTGLAALNMLLRTVTMQPVSLSAPMRSVAIAGLMASTLGGVVSAAPPSVAPLTSSDGYERAVVLPDSTATIVLAPDGRWGRIAWVSPGPQPPTPPPQPPPTPNPNLTDRAKAIKVAADKVSGDLSRAKTAHDLAALYRKLAELARTPGQVNDATALASRVRADTDSLLSAWVAASWQPVRDILGTQWTTLTYRPNPPPTLEDYAKLLGEAADGLEASAISLLKPSQP